MLILGIDPSMHSTGISVLQLDSRDRLSIVETRLVQLKKNKLLLISEITNALWTTLNELFNKYQLQEVAMEQIPFVNNKKIFYNLSLVSGVIIAWAKIHNLPIYTYTPPFWKSFVTGAGNADKERVQRSIQAIFRLAIAPQNDLADSIGVATTHLKVTKQEKEQHRI